MIIANILNRLTSNNNQSINNWLKLSGQFFSYFHVENLWQYNRPVGRKLDSYTGDINPLIPRSAI